LLIHDLFQRAVLDRAVEEVSVHEIAGGTG
jgi:hypothetical protein